jgi:xylulose-5-phosphate/fructose-6-phosphate phosphoketolase
MTAVRPKSDARDARRDLSAVTYRSRSTRRVCWLFRDAPAVGNRQNGTKVASKPDKPDGANVTREPRGADRDVDPEQCMKTATLSPDLLYKIDAYWRAANYLSVGQIYLYDNPLLREPLTMAHVKPLVVGHWGTVPGQNFIYVHLNRVIKKYDVDMIYVSGPGHGGAALVGNVYLEGTWSEVYPAVTQDEAGMKKLFKQFSFPGGISSHVAPTTPGSINEGGELGYSLSHAFGAAFDNPELIVACVIGDGEAETGPLATAWQSTKMLSPVADGAVLPILHLNGFKISNPTILARVERQELEQFFMGCGWAPLFVEGDDPTDMHQAMASAMERAIEQIQTIQDDARNRNVTVRPRWPMIVLRSPKGWTGPSQVDGLQIEGTFRSHQVPLLVDPSIRNTSRCSSNGCRATRPRNSSTRRGACTPNWPSWHRPGSAAWVRIRTPTAGCCCANFGCLISGNMPST